MWKEKEITGFHGGFNFLDTYLLKFCNIIEEVSSGSTPETFKYNIPDQEVKYGIVNLCPTEPWELPNWAILENKTLAFLDKLEEIKVRYFPKAHFFIAINKKEDRTIAEAMNYASNADNAEWMKIFALDPKYPQNDPVLLAKVILGIDINFGQDTMDLGILILDAQTVSAVYESCILENKVNSRLIAISGTGLKENEIINVQLGTSVDKVLHYRTVEAGDYRVFINGPLRGKEISDLSQKIDWSTNNIVVLKEQDSKVMFPMLKSGELTFTTNTHGELRQCIYCNFCDSICPADLEPALYYHSYIRGEKHKARLYNLEKCIECGLCSFICPSKLELLRIIRECKALGKKL
ncbi:MAG: 4Fe-4S dicluster domain-containing protein [Candidatus Jettenia caeni]|nr:MAG: 4Fe-4S dicluster domain-containing protein [Candidatus Jettenia caeni]